MPASPDLMFQVVGRFMSRLPAERHRALRAHFSGLFTPRRVERYRVLIEHRTEDLLDRFPDRGPLDFVAAFARPLPFGVIADVLGVPSERHDWLASRMEVFGRAVAGQRDHANVEAGNEATRDMLDYFDEAISVRELDPQDDVLTLLGQGSPVGDERDDLLANCVFFVLAGHMTTTALLSAGIEILLAHPGQLQALKDQPERWPSGIEELLRFVSPTTLTGAAATADVEVVGCPVPAGAQRALVFAAANRDPDVFTNPDSFETSRIPNPHLAFSAGAHFCLGAPLARLHAQIALPAVFGRLNNLRLDEDPAWIGSVPVRQVARLAINWTT
jgi:pimeloyl-[acyl-carrier protein] synthase